jgi:hypothetical protein
MERIRNSVYVRDSRRSQNNRSVLSTDFSRSPRPYKRYNECLEAPARLLLSEHASNTALCPVRSSHLSASCGRVVKAA